MASQGLLRLRAGFARNALGKQIGNNFQVSCLILSIVEFMKKYHQFSVSYVFQIFVINIMQVIDTSILQNEEFDRIENRNGQTQVCNSGILRLEIGGLSYLMTHSV